MRPLEQPRFTEVADGAGHYESFYLTAIAPEGGRAVWIRNTILKRPGSAPRPTLWVTDFDATRAPRRERVTLDGPPAVDAWLRSGAAHAGPGAFTGSAGDARWDLRIEEGEERLPYLPSLRLYDAKLPSTKAVALHPRARVSGSVEVSGERTEVDGWDAMVGHNWGAEHAEHWVWVHAALPDGGWFDAVLGRTRLGPLLAPWMGGGALLLRGGGERVRLGGPLGRTRVEVHGEQVELTIPAAGRRRLVVRTSLPAVSTVRWDYASPSGAARDVRNCSVADLELELGGERRSVAQAAAIEVGVPAG